MVWLFCLLTHRVDMLQENTSARTRNLAPPNYHAARHAADIDFTFSILCVFGQERLLAARVGRATTATVFDGGFPPTRISTSPCAFSLSHRFHV